MLRVLKSILPVAGQHIPRRRRHQFVPSVADSAANLEGRTMLSGAGGAAVAHAAVHHAAIHHGAAHHAMARHAMLHHNAAHHAMARHAAPHHHAQVHHAMARHAAAHHARFHAAAGRPAIMSKEQGVVAERRAFAAATGAPAPHDPVITTANAGGGTINSGLTGSLVPGMTTGAVPLSNFAGTGLGAGTFNGFATVPGTLPAGLQSTFQVANGLGVAEPAVVAQFPASSAMTRFFSTSPIGAVTNGNTGLNAINASALASALTSLLGGTGTTLAGTGNTALASELASLLGGTGTTTIGTGTGTGTLAESPLAALLLGGQVPTAGLTTTAGTTGTLASLINTLSPLRSPVNPSPLPFNGTLPFTRSPVNPSPLPFNGSLAFTRTPVNPSPLPFNGTLPFTRSPINPSPLPLNGVLM